MATKIVMPSLGMYEAEATLIEWVRAAGDAVEGGDVVAVIETEKANVEIPAPAAGVLHPVAAPGTRLGIESLMGYLLGPGESPPTPTAAATKAPTPAAPRAAAAERQAPASPIAKRLAREHGVDLAAVGGSGPGGRIVEADVRAAIESAASPPAPGGGPRVERRTPLAGRRGAIAERLRRSLDTAAQLTLTREIEAGALVRARRRLAAELAAEIPYDALFVKLLAGALVEHRELNAVVEGDALVVLDEVHVGVAVDVADGLVVPVVRAPAARPIGEIAAEVTELVARARSGHLRPDDLVGGTATVSNLGAHGIDAFTPILNPPQSVILGVGRIAPRPVVRDGTLAVGETVVLSLTFDHRVADGAPAARLLAAVAAVLGDEDHLMSWASRR